MPEVLKCVYQGLNDSWELTRRLTEDRPSFVPRGVPQWRHCNKVDAANGNTIAATVGSLLFLSTTSDGGFPLSLLCVSGKAVGPRTARVRCPTGTIVLWLTWVTAEQGLLILEVANSVSATAGTGVRRAGTPRPVSGRSARRQPVRATVEGSGHSKRYVLLSRTQKK